jgi:hypothetical protein
MSMSAGSSQMRQGISSSLSAESLAWSKCGASALAIRALAPDGVDRIIEVASSENVDLDAAVAKNNAVIAAYAWGQS